jgi:hypothetical protein
MNRRLVIAGLLALVVVGAILLTRRNEDRSTAFWSERAQYGRLPI